jgi:hypothetical protein
MLRELVGQLNKAKKTTMEGYLESFNISSLNLSVLQPTYLITHTKSLVGKEFKIFLQAAPFVLFPFLTADKRDLWYSLSILSTYVFQTHISNMDNFKSNLNNHISHFIHHAIKSTAQWINKPKFHMLTHLAASIRRFGPATLFATEKFELYNGILRNASTHSNRLAPGRDIATKFFNFHALRSILSGGLTYNSKTQTFEKSSPQIQNVFLNTPLIQTSMGYNQLSYQTYTQFPYQNLVSLPKADKLSVPTILTERFPNSDFHQVACLQFTIESNQCHPEGPLCSGLSQFLLVCSCYQN